MPGVWSLEPELIHMATHFIPWNCLGRTNCFLSGSWSPFWQRPPSSKVWRRTCRTHTQLRLSNRNYGQIDWRIGCSKLVSSTGSLVSITFMTVLPRYVQQLDQHIVLLDKEYDALNEELAKGETSSFDEKPFPWNFQLSLTMLSVWHFWGDILLGGGEPLTSPWTRVLSCLALGLGLHIFSDCSWCFSNRVPPKHS